ncbi:MAG: O-acetyl-ADP-ribose deacetylase [Clostridiales bacterium]|jgi:O-acetyl-ADP-ribose deacetylase (regulator of RNase III)|nr:O-acetyl-ADP-ribose deacetylase [Clostridiales bacterium]
MAIKIIRGDITKVKADAIVNAANSTLLGGGGVDGAIHRAAGPELLAECKTLNGCKVGEAKITKGYNLPAKFVIHTVGPVWRGGGFGEDKLLKDCYINSLRLAAQNGVETIAFPLISGGAYGYPKGGAIGIAMDAFGEFLSDNDMDIALVIFDNKTFELPDKLYEDIKRYINENLVDSLPCAQCKYSERPLAAERRRFERPLAERRVESPSYIKRREDLTGGGAGKTSDGDGDREESRESPLSEAERKDVGDKTVADDENGGAEDIEREMFVSDIDREMFASDIGAEYEKRERVAKQLLRPRFPNAAYSDVQPARSLEDLIEGRDETFSQSLLRLIDQTGMTDPEVYKRANVDRKLFSKIRGDKNYRPSKATAVAFAVALRLDLDGALDLIGRAGFTLSPSTEFDLIIRYFIERGDHNIDRINEALFRFDQVLLGV